MPAYATAPGYSRGQSRPPNQYAALRRTVAYTQAEILLKYAEQPVIDRNRHFNPRFRRPTRIREATTARRQQTQARNGGRKAPPSITPTVPKAKAGFRQAVLAFTSRRPGASPVRGSHGMSREEYFRVHGYWPS